MYRNHLHLFREPSVGPSRSWSNGRWIYNYICNQYISPLTLWVRIPLRRGVLDTTLCDQVCQWLAAGRWFSPDTSVSSTNKTDRHDITEILLTKQVWQWIKYKSCYYLYRRHVPEKTWWHKFVFAACSSIV